MKGKMPQAYFDDYKRFRDRQAIDRGLRKNFKVTVTYITHHLEAKFTLQRGHDDVIACLREMFDKSIGVQCRIKYKDYTVHITMSRIDYDRYRQLVSYLTLALGQEVTSAVV